MRHVTESQQFTRQLLQRLFQDADRMHEALGSSSGRRELTKLHENEVLFTIFYEPSTRTRLSFETAGSRLGMKIVSTESAAQFSSAIKGETLEDTFRVLCALGPDVIALRHKETGAAARAISVSSVPVINAGDGTGQHPTQALLDLYTIQREKGKVDGLTIAIGGDLAHGRTARSLAYLLGKFTGVSVVFISPSVCRIGDDIKAYLDRHGVRFSETEDLFPAASECDVLYWTRVQKERMSAELYEAIADRYVINADTAGKMRDDMIIMHPLPRVHEISVEVDTDPRAAYFRQVANGLVIRMALLHWILSEGA
ncbi:aspartate carbamoyltransferase [Candidatus Kaiserbacteria bacterium]|nr:aspartate carbamoyltransferase [Candidatus Kaiserbacteria bacterium]